MTVVLFRGFSERSASGVCLALWLQLSSSFSSRSGRVVSERSAQTRRGRRLVLHRWVELNKRSYCVRLSHSTGFNPNALESLSPVSKRQGYTSRRINVRSPLESTADPPVWRLAESLRHFKTLKTFKRVHDIQLLEDWLWLVAFKSGRGTLRKW